MNRIAAVFGILTYIECASYQRYGESAGILPQHSTITNLYNQYPYKSSYGNDMANFPEATRYPNFGSTPSYDSGSSVYNPGSNVYNQPSSGFSQEYGGYSSYEMPFMKDIRDYCVNRSPQSGIWVDSLMGMWYGVEFVQHLAGDSRIDYMRTCIVVHIAEPIERPSTENQLFHVQHINAKFKQQYRHLRLLWDEAGQTIEYALYFRNDSAGYWKVYDGQNGTLTTRSNYQQFSGIIQVLKAVQDHLVLNFCQEPSNGRPAQLYSVLFSREPGVLARWEVESVHNLLQTKKLSIASRRMVCGNTATKLFHNVILSSLTCLFAYIVSAL
ncbi:hypothetical protein ACJJTC_007854 [Scirpophaga incertulas]